VESESAPGSNPFSWPAAIAEPFLDLITRRLAVTERTDQAYPMRHPESGETTGAVQVFDGSGLQALVLSTAHTPHLRMWQAVAFTPPTSPLPHLSFDAKANPGGCWFSIDLVPRVAPTEHHAWASHVYEPLSDLVWSIHEREDMRQSLIRSRHRMHLSPWLISMRLDQPSAVPAAVDAVLAVTERFCDLVGAGLPDDAVPAVAADALAERDAREREHLYAWETTANYRYLAMIGGDESVDVVQGTLRDPDAVRLRG
jgi:hypothetical protein